MKKIILLVAVIVFPIAVHARGLWSDIKKGVSDSADSVSDAAKSVTQKETPAEKRNEIDSMANATLQRLFREQGSAKTLYNKSQATAVAGSDSKDAAARFTQGMAVYELTEKGIKLTVDITGTKYWKDDDLN